MKRKDPLHIPSAELVVNYEGHEVLILNKMLLDRQNCWENLEAIKEMHFWKIALGDLMCDTRDGEELSSYDDLMTGVEFMLQELWGFPLNTNYHRFWDRPRCGCPRMDNEERYGTKYHIVMLECPLHGDKAFNLRQESESKGLESDTEINHTCHKCSSKKLIPKMFCYICEGCRVVVKHFK